MMFNAWDKSESRFNTEREIVRVCVCVCVCVFAIGQMSNICCRVLSEVAKGFRDAVR